MPDTPVNTTELFYAIQGAENADDAHLEQLVKDNDTRLKAIEDRIAAGVTAGRVTTLEARVVELEKALALVASDLDKHKKEKK